MVDYHKQLRLALKDILPVYYELTLDSKCSVPCISYYERNNEVNVNGDTCGYANVSYYIKIWGNNIEVIQDKALEVDEALRQLGWNRVSATELFDQNSTMIQKIMVYQALFHENYNME